MRRGSLPDSNHVGPHAPEVLQAAEHRRPGAGRFWQGSISPTPARLTRVETVRSCNASSGVGRNSVAGRCPRIRSRGSRQAKMVIHWFATPTGRATARLGRQARAVRRPASVRGHPPRFVAGLCRPTAPYVSPPCDLVSEGGGRGP